MIEIDWEDTSGDYHTSCVGSVAGNEYFRIHWMGVNKWRLSSQLPSLKKHIADFETANSAKRVAHIMVNCFDQHPDRLETLVERIQRIGIDDEAISGFV